MRAKSGHSLTAKIQAAVAAHPNGIAIEALHIALNKAPVSTPDADTVLLTSRRTLQRRVSEMAAQHLIVTTGKGRGLRYHSLEAAGSATAPRVARQVPSAYLVNPEPYVPISAKGLEIRDYIRQPVQQRTPVAYDRTLLEAYRPNDTFYLPQEIREHLHNIGRSPAHERPAGTYARDILGRLLIDLSWASSRLEGNTYTRLDTQNLIELGQAADGHDQREAQMILNHKAAIEMLVEGGEEIGFNPFTFFNLHTLLSNNLLTDQTESGRLRRRIVEISGSVFYPLSIPQQIDVYFRMILGKASAIADPFEQAFFVMVQVPYLQPFIDVNKRVSRLGANIPLIRHNLCPVSFIDVPERAYVEGTLGVYELKKPDLLRDVFVWAYERSCQRYIGIRATTAEPDPVRLRYHEAIITAVAEIVRGLQPIDAGSVRALAASLVPQADLDRVAEMALADLRDLHEGNVLRYRLRLSEYRAWRAVAVD